MTPYVVNDQSDLRRVLDKKMKERREFVERFGGEDRHELDQVADYRRKRGMLEEINRAAKEIQLEEDEIEAIRIQQATDESGPLEPSMMPKPGAAPAAPKGNEKGGGGPTAPPPPPADHNPPPPPPVEAPTTTPPPSGAP